MPLSPELASIIAPIVGTIGGAEVGSTIQGAAHRRALQQTKDDGISHLRTWLLVKRHLGPDALVVPRPGIGNAFYTRTADGRPAVVYDPRLRRRSIIGHEIGHGVREQEGRLSNILYGPSRALGPLTSTVGALAAGSSRSLRPLGLGVAAAGAGMSVPHLWEEWAASRKANQVTGSSKGLNAALATYLSTALAVPAASGGIALLAKRLLRRR